MLIMLFLELIGGILIIVVAYSFWKTIFSAIEKYLYGDSEYARTYAHIKRVEPFYKIGKFFSWFTIIASLIVCSYLLACLLCPDDMGVYIMPVMQDKWKEIETVMEVMKK